MIQENFIDSLNNAYSHEPINIISNNDLLSFSDNYVDESNSDKPMQISLEDTSIDFNIWDIMGVSSLPKDKQNCFIDCGIKSLHSLENCENKKESLLSVFDKTKNKKCKIKSYKHALKCAKSCYNLENNIDYSTPKNLLTNNNNNNSYMNNIFETPQVVQTTQPMTSQSITEKVQQNNENNINGLYASISDYAPVEAKYWPNETRKGWDTDSIHDYNEQLSNKVIEVRSKQYTDFDISKPYIEFSLQNNNDNESKSRQFFPYSTPGPKLQFDEDGLDMMLHQVEGFQNVEGYSNNNNKNNNNNNNVKVENKVFKVGQLVLDRKCPHNGCKLYYKEDEDIFKCPCHNSTFNKRGDCLSGPACPSNIRI